MLPAAGNVIQHAVDDTDPKLKDVDILLLLVLLQLQPLEEVAVSHPLMMTSEEVAVLKIVRLTKGTHEAEVVHNVVINIVGVKGGVFVGILVILYCEFDEFDITVHSHPSNGVLLGHDVNPYCPISYTIYNAEFVVVELHELQVPQFESFTYTLK